MRRCVTLIWAGINRHFTPLCGSGLARDGSAAVFLKYRVEAIASKPAPTCLLSDNFLPAQPPPQIVENNISTL